MLAGVCSWPRAAASGECPIALAARAAITDAQAVRAVHCETWAATYADLVATEFFKYQLEAHRHRDWQQLIVAQRFAGGGVLLARDPTSSLIGFCQFGSTEDEDDDPAEVGEILRLYVPPGQQRKGVGRALVDRALSELAAQANTWATLWVLDLEADFRAVAFYEHTGWTPDGARRFDGATDVRSGGGFRSDPSRQPTRFVAFASATGHHPMTPAGRLLGLATTQSAPADQPHRPAAPPGAERALRDLQGKSFHAASPADCRARRRNGSPTTTGDPTMGGEGLEPPTSCV